MATSNKLQALWAGLRDRCKKKHFEILCEESGIELASVPANAESRRLDWERIHSVFAYKRDLITADQVRLILGGERQQRWLEVTEEDIGFEVLLNELEARFPGFSRRPEWWDKITQPPFETQWTELYRRSSD